MVGVYCGGTFGQNLTCLGSLFAFRLMIEMASRQGKVQMSMWFVAASLPLLASKTAMGVALSLSLVLRAMVVRMCEVKMSFGCMFLVAGVLLRFLKTSWFEDLSSSLCRDCWVLRGLTCSSAIGGTGCSGLLGGFW